MSRPVGLSGARRVEETLLRGVSRRLDAVRDPKEARRGVKLGFPWARFQNTLGRISSGKES